MPFSFSHPNGSAIPWAVWNRPLPASRRLRYHVRSSFVPAPAIAQTALASLTRLPDQTPPSLRQLSLQLRQTGDTEQQRLAALEAWFRSNDFRYSRSDLPTGNDALERFLFETRSGHCEFFASGFALLARAQVCQPGWLVAITAASTTSWVATTGSVKSGPMSG